MITFCTLKKKKKCLPLPWPEWLPDLESQELESLDPEFLDPVFLDPEFLKSDPLKQEPLDKKRIVFVCILIGLCRCDFINTDPAPKPHFDFVT